MASSFMGLYVQRDALLLSQKSLDITGNNISNIHTVGYSRQRVDICSIANARGTLGYNTSVTLAGRGSQAIGVAQVRDRVLDRKVRDYSGDLCNVGVKVSTLKDVESLFDSIEIDAESQNLDGSSLTSILTKLKSALQSFSSDNANRTELANIVMNTAKSLAHSINSTNQKLDDINNQSLIDTKATVDRINAIFSQMGVLNKQIKDAYVAMGYIEKTNNNYQVMNDYGPLELKDEMNKLLDELAQYGNIDFKEEWDGTFTVHFANQLVVEGKKYAQMAMTETNPRPTELAFVITKAERDEKGNIIGGLYDKDDWYNMHVSNRTGGDAQALVRKSLREFVGVRGEDINTVNITGQRSNGTNYLDSGSLRGYLDVYNGRGLYADNDYSGGLNDDGRLDFFNSFTKAMEAIDRLLYGDPKGMDYTDITNALRDIGAQFKFDDEANTYTITLNDVVIYDNTDPDNIIDNTTKLSMGYDENGNGIIMLDGETIQTVSNAHQIVQRQVDIANNALQRLQEAALSGTALSTEELNELVQALQTSIGAQFKINSSTGDYEVPYIVEVNGVVIFDGSMAKALKLRNPDTPNSLGNVEVYAEGPTEEDIQEMVAAAEAALQKLAALTKPTEPDADADAETVEQYNKDLAEYNAQLDEIASALKNSIGADLDKDTATASIDGKTITAGDIGYEDTADGWVITAGGDPVGKPISKSSSDDPANWIRTVTINHENGVEYYRDMLNAFVKSITDAFNNVYKGVEVMSNAYKEASNNLEYANSYIRELAAGNVSPNRFDAIKKGLEKIFGDGNVTISPDPPVDGEKFTVEIGGETVLNDEGEVTEIRLVKDDNGMASVMINETELGQPAKMEAYITKNYEMFTFDYDNFRRAAETFRLSEDWLSDPMFISDPTKDNKFEELDNIYINKLLGIFSEDATGKLTYNDGFGHGEEDNYTLEQYIDHISANLGDEISRVSFEYTDTDILLTGVEEDRSVRMDVSMNEEGISMMNYQKWYNAISRMISTMDEALDKLINQTGLVGLR